MRSARCKLRSSQIWLTRWGERWGSAGSGDQVGCGSADAGRPRGLLAGEAKKATMRSLGSDIGTRRKVHAVGHAACSSVGAPHANRNASSVSFGAFGARCTQFCPTVHAVEAWCTQLFPGPERRAASSTCAFDASRSFRGLRNCVHRTPFACSVGQNCVYCASPACSVGRNCVHRTPTACTVRRDPAPEPNVYLTSSMSLPPASPVAALRQPNSQPTSPPCVSLSHSPQRPDESGWTMTCNERIAPIAKKLGALRDWRLARRYTQWQWQIRVKGACHGRADIARRQSLGLVHA